LIARSTRTLSKSSVRTRTKRFHSLSALNAGVLDTVVKYAAIAALGLAVLDARLELALAAAAAAAATPCFSVGESPTLDALVNDPNGSPASLPGVVIGLGSPDGIVETSRALAFCARRLAFAAVGDARRDRVLRNVDLRLGGGKGRESGWMGNGGTLRVAWEWRSLRSSSTSSMAVRVKVRLWVGAK